MKQFFEKNKRIIFWLLFSSIIFGQIFLQYYGLLKYDYLVPPGDDGVNHFILADKFLNGQNLFHTIISTSYPPFFHWLTAMLAKLFHLSTIQTLLFFTPALTIIASISIYWLTKIIFNRRAALIAMLAYSFLALSPYQLLSDGGYPNLLASGVFIPLFIGFVSRVIEKKLQVWNLIGAIGIFILILITHHLSSIYLIVILILSLPFLIICYAKTTSKIKIALYSSIATVLVIIFFYILFKTSLLNPIKQMIYNAITFSKSYPFIHLLQSSEPNTILNVKASSLLIGTPILLFGLIGILYFTFIEKWCLSKNKTIMMVIIWALILLMGSRLSNISNPDRLVRDAVIPLVVLTGGVLEIGLFQIKYFSWKLVIIIVLILLSTQPFFIRIRNSIIFNDMVRYTVEDKNAISKIAEKDHEPTILALSCDDWLNYLIPGNKSLVDNKGGHQILDRLSHFDYIYAEIDSASWMPTRCVEPHLNQLRKYPQIVIEDNYQKKYSTVYIFKVRR